MGTAIRKHLRDFIAVAILIVLAGGVTIYILQEQRLRIPVFEERPFELKAEFETAQAVVPGQGQTVRVAGVRIGDVTKVEVEDGVGVVTFNIDREYLPIYRDATILMRPTTGLKDMFFQLDPGTAAAGEYEEGDTVHVANTAPDVNLDEVLAALDSDTQAYLRLLLVGAGQGLCSEVDDETKACIDGRDKELGKLLGGLGPINKDLAQLSRQVAQRKDNLARLIHNLNVLTTAVGRNDEELTRLVSSSQAALSAIAEQDPSVRSAVRQLPGTLGQAEDTLTATADFATLLGPTVDNLRPFARNLEPLNASLSELAKGATPALRDEIRPFVRAARPVVPDLRTAAQDFGDATPGLTRLGKKLNNFGNTVAYNPNGAESPETGGRDEGWLYWTAWSTHVGNSLFSAGDANASYWRVYLSQGCEAALNLIGSVDPLIEEIRQLITGLTDPILEQVGCTS
jgi:phospholipid/cholesterol/gamma-HCH transport system substrate-binding protein